MNEGGLRVPSPSDKSSTIGLCEKLNVGIRWANSNKALPMNIYTLANRSTIKMASLELRWEEEDFVS